MLIKAPLNLQSDRSYNPSTVLTQKQQESHVTQRWACFSVPKSEILKTCTARGKVTVECLSELLLGPFFQPLFHLKCMLLAALPLLQSLFFQALTHCTVHIVTRAKELQDIMLRVALP